MPCLSKVAAPKLEVPLPEIEITMVWRKKDKKPILARFVGFAMKYQALGK
jgi:hypothetical protein